MKKRKGARNGNLRGGNMSVQEFTKKKEEKEVKQTDEKNFAIWQTIEDISKSINKLSAIKQR